MLKVIRPFFVEYVPAKLDEEVLYISRKYKVAVHLCCCGCGEKVVTPLSPAEWSIHGDEKMVSLHPSVGNWSMACRSHYCIKNNKVVVAREFESWEIERVRAHDARDLERQIHVRNSQLSFFATFKAVWRRLVSVVWKIRK
ncbi:MAG: hypothetical protein LBE33_04255 [Zoogloeaceae bacterium]|nr:hypothetical protein [Zoogloeaceae bacterium]